MKPTSIMIHHTAVSYTKNPDQFKATDAYHKKKWNVKSSLGFYCGYHYEIAANGLIHQARKDGEPAVACYQKKMNDGRCLHICLDGNFDNEEAKPKQIYVLRDLLRKLAKKYKIKEEGITFHRDFARKTCPGRRIKLDFIRSLINTDFSLDF